VVVPGHRAPRPVPDTVWAAWAGPNSALSPRRMAGFVPVYERAPDPFGMLADPLPTRYGDGLPSWLAAGLARPAADGPNLHGPTFGPLASAEGL
jgi:hypothetical protein